MMNDRDERFRSIHDALIAVSKDFNRLVEEIIEEAPFEKMTTDDMALMMIQNDLQRVEYMMQIRRWSL